MRPHWKAGLSPPRFSPQWMTGFSLFSLSDSETPTPRLLRSRGALTFPGAAGRIILLRFTAHCAQVAELADALDSGSSAGNGVGVRIPPWAPSIPKDAHQARRARTSDGPRTTGTMVLVEYTPVWVRTAFLLAVVYTNKPDRVSTGVTPSD